eukprot:SAG31_NODE_4239_length_3431_cov_2.742197_4_plen_258_part_00
MQTSLTVVVQVYAELEKLRIGSLAAGEKIVTVDPTADPYLNEPLRDESIVVHKQRPFNAETPIQSLDANFLTPTALFYVRHHHPVPTILQETTRTAHTVELALAAAPPALSLAAEAAAATAPPKRTALTFDFCGPDGQPVEAGDGDEDTDFTIESELSVGDLERSRWPLGRRFKKAELVATLQCGGNRRAELDDIGVTQGLKWEFGAISTAKFEGVWLRDVLRELGLRDEEGARHKGVRWVQFFGDDAPVSMRFVRR